MSGKVDVRSLVARLNKCCKLSLEKAAALCVSKAHSEVTIEHFLYTLLGFGETDARLLLARQMTEHETVRTAVESSFLRIKMDDAGTAPVFSPLLVELFQDALLVSTVELGGTEIRSGAILIALVRSAGRYVHFEYAKIIDRLSANMMVRNFHNHTSGSVEGAENSGATNDRKDNAVSTKFDDESALQKFGINFTQLARDGEIDPVFCRDDEIYQICEILGRRRKNNPICVGEAGVGKSAVAEGLALRIVEEDVPDYLIGVELWTLDMGALQAGASVKGEFEKRLKAVITEVKQSKASIILFIDEAHTLIGAGGQAGGGDAANLLKPALARGELKTIAATTWSEYKKYFEKDPALARRFQLVKLDEPTIEQAEIILRGLREPYEKSHGVYITDEAVSAAASLSARYITGRQLPDKAIDVLDTACARVKLNLTSLPARIEKLQNRETVLEREKQSLERDLAIGLRGDDILERLQILSGEIKVIRQEHEPLAELYKKQKELVELLCKQRRQILDLASNCEDEEEETAAARESEIALSSSLEPDSFSQGPIGDHGEARPAETSEKPSATLEEDTVVEDIRQLRVKLDEHYKKGFLVGAEVTPETIASVIADWTGIPVSSMVQDDFEKLINLSENMGKTIKGQDFALKSIETRLRASRLDLHKKNQPLGVFLLAGTSGTGKTETALELARQIFGGEQFVTTINMSEYQEQHTISRLIGSPPGYVGYGEGGILTEAIRKKPYSVVLLDEVEKADVNVLNLFYQAFDKGELADGEGRIIDCKNCIFILTSNLGSDQIVSWVGNASEEKPVTPEQVTRSLQPIFSNHFKPALLARMQPIAFMPLSDEVMAEIVVAKIEELKQRLLDTQDIVFEITDPALEKIKSQCVLSSNGARLIDLVIQSQLIPPISMEILERGLEDQKLQSVIVDFNEEHGFAFGFPQTEPSYGKEDAA